jgi:hypothetical protein
MTDRAQILPFRVKDGLQKLGSDINIARRRRRMPIAEMCERSGIGVKTCQRIEKGEPSVSMAAYMMVLFVLGLDRGLAELAAPSIDAAGFAAEAEQLPRRVSRARRKTKQNADTPDQTSSW